MEILLLEDSADDAKLVELELHRAGLKCRFQHVCDGKSYVTALKNYLPDLILSDYTLPQYDGMAALRDAAMLAPGTPVIIVTGSINEETAVECMKAGAADYVLKPNMARLVPAIHTALERKKVLQEKEMAEKALRESERRFRNLADTAPVLIWMSGADAQFVYLNQPWLDFTGRSREDELGEGWAEAIHDEDLPRHLRTYHQAMANHETFQSEFRLRRADGDYRWMLSHGAPRFLTGGVFAGFVGSAIDITDRKQAERALLASEARHSAILKASLDSIVTLDHEGRIVEFNPAAEFVFGFERDMVTGEKMAEWMIPVDLREEFQSSLEQCAAGECDMLGKRVEMTVLRSDGTEFQVEVAITRINVDGPPMFTAYMQDITQRRHNEREREHLIHELQEALAKVKTLSGLLPVCAQCKKIRDGEGRWTQMEVYIRQRTDAEFTHGYCPDCARRFRESFENALPLGKL
jgi:PAS domain S-box-containing protein